MINEDIIKEYPFELKLWNENIRFRKWKLVDRINFINDFKSENGEHINNLLKNAIYPNKLAFTKEELKYILLNIYCATFGKDVEYELKCLHCEKEYIEKINLFDIFKPNYSENNIIETEKNKVVIGPIKNKEAFYEVYNSSLSKIERDLLELAFMADSVNDSKSLTSDELIESLYEMDAGEFEQIMEKFNDMKFILDSDFKHKCPHCSEVSDYGHASYPNLVPYYWIEEEQSSDE